MPLRVAGAVGLGDCRSRGSCFKKLLVIYSVAKNSLFNSGIRARSSGLGGLGYGLRVSRVLCSGSSVWLQADFITFRASHSVARVQVAWFTGCSVTAACLLEFRVCSLDERSGAI